MSYKPYRVLKRIVVVITDSDDAAACYPHGNPGQRMIATGKVLIVYDACVIDAPTEEEVALFDLPGLSNSVKLIPQDSRGFDERLSGVARSVRGSQRGQEAAKIEEFERKSAAELAKPKPEPEPDAESVTKSGSKPKSKPKARAGSKTKPEAIKPVSDEKKEGDLNE